MGEFTHPESTSEEKHRQLHFFEGRLIWSVNNLKGGSFISFTNIFYCIIQVTWTYKNHQTNSIIIKKIECNYSTLNNRNMKRVNLSCHWKGYQRLVEGFIDDWSCNGHSLLYRYYLFWNKVLIILKWYIMTRCLLLNQCRLS